MHVPPVCEQLIAAGRLTTDPVPTTPTANVASLPPPGQSSLAGLSTVTVAKANITFPAPPVPSGTLAEISPPPQAPCAGVNKPGVDMVTTPSSTFQVAWLVRSIVAGGGMWVRLTVCG